MLNLKISLFWVIFSFLGVNCGFLSSALKPDNTSYTTVLPEIIPSNECRQKPCLFGMSLEGLSYEEVRLILTTHPLTEDATFSFEPTQIAWEWSDRVKPTLLSDGFTGLSPWDDLNLVWFEDNKVSGIAIAFGYSLEDIIAIVGGEFNVYPFADRGRGGTTYILQFPEHRGWFETLRSCDSLTFNRRTPIVKYLYWVDELPYYVQWGEEPIRWSGYETQVQNCSAFVPG